MSWYTCTLYHDYMMILLAFNIIVCMCLCVLKRRYRCYISSVLVWILYVQFVIILRGLPGSGKTCAAKLIKVQWVSCVVVMHTYIFTCISCVHVCLYMFVFFCVYVCLCVCLCVCVCVCMPEIDILPVSYKHILWLQVERKSGSWATKLCTFHICKQ